MPLFISLLFLSLRVQFAEHRSCRRPLIASVDLASSSTRSIRPNQHYLAQRFLHQLNSTAPQLHSIILFKISAHIPHCVCRRPTSDPSPTLPCDPGKRSLSFCHLVPQAVSSSPGLHLIPELCNRGSDLFANESSGA